MQLVADGDGETSAVVLSSLIWEVIQATEFCRRGPFRIIFCLLVPLTERPHEPLERAGELKRSTA